MKKKAPRNKTITLSGEQLRRYSANLLTVNKQAAFDDLINKTICQDIFEVVDKLPDAFVDVLIADPPYNIAKKFNTNTFSRRSSEKYAEYIDSWLSKMIRLLKPTATVYVCCDWRCSSCVQDVLAKYLTIRNRITWEREKGRGAVSNWKNSSEDIWFATVGDEYKFNVDAVKLNKRIIAPYTNADGSPKDWKDGEKGKFRQTCPSNLWTDLTVPFWSMPENTEHPTQKPEKLMAKLILAGSDAGDVIFDPFLGSGTTSVVAKKLGRKYLGVELDQTYCCLAEKRLEDADNNKNIQGYENGLFYERNSRKS